MITLYKGKRGCGKTVTLVKDGKKFELKGWRILRNFECEFGEEITNDEILALDKESDVKNAVLMIDEIQIFFDSRRSMKKGNLDFSNFLQQIRKRNIVLLCTTQYANTIDLRLRQHVDIIAMPKFLKQYGLIEVTYYDMTSLEDEMGLGIIKQPESRTIIYNPEPIFKLYNSWEMQK